MGDKIIGLSTEGGNIMGMQRPVYVALDLDISRGYFAISGTEGYIWSEEDLNAYVDDYWENLDLEDEYGYMADEAAANADHTWSATERQDFLEGMKADLMGDWPYPEEINYDIGAIEVDGVTYYATVFAGGQLKSAAKSALSDLILPREDMQFIIRAWDDYQLKKLDEVPPDVLARTKRIFDGLDNRRAMRQIIGFVELQAESPFMNPRPRAHRGLKPGQQRLMRRPVQVRQHMRKVR